MTTGDIAAHLFDVYDKTIDRSTISRVTDGIVDDMLDWQSRPLDPIYPVLLVDGIRIKIRDGTVTNRTVYVVMGINMDGERDILCLWVGPTGGESAKFWLGVLSELKNRGVEDVLMLCCDGLKGLPDSARSVWPMVDVQLCVVHLVRNSLRFASKADWQPITKQLKAIYTAPSLAAAEEAFEEFAEDWEAKYPSTRCGWQNRHLLSAENERQKRMYGSAGFVFQGGQRLQWRCQGFEPGQRLLSRTVLSHSS